MGAGKPKKRTRTRAVEVVGAPSPASAASQPAPPVLANPPAQPDSRSRQDARPAAVGTGSEAAPENPWRGRGPAWALLVAALALSIGAYWRFDGLGNQGFWADEATFSPFCAEPNALQRLFKEPVDSPLEMAPRVLAMRLLGRQDEFAYRLPSALCGMLALSVAIAFLAADKTSAFPFAAASLFFAAHPFLVVYSREARYYSQLSLVGVVLLAGACLLSRGLLRFGRSWETCPGVSPPRDSTSAIQAAVGFGLATLATIVGLFSSPIPASGLAGAGLALAAIFAARLFSGRATPREALGQFAALAALAAVMASVAALAYLYMLGVGLGGSAFQRSLGLHEYSLSLDLFLRALGQQFEPRWGPVTAAGSIATAPDDLFRGVVLLLLAAWGTLALWKAGRKDVAVCAASIAFACLAGTMAMTRGRTFFHARYACFGAFPLALLTVYGPADLLERGWRRVASSGAGAGARWAAASIAGLALALAVGWRTSSPLLADWGAQQPYKPTLQLGSAIADVMGREQVWVSEPPRQSSRHDYFLFHWKELGLYPSVKIYPDLAAWEAEIATPASEDGASPIYWYVTYTPPRPGRDFLEPWFDAAAREGRALWIYAGDFRLVLATKGAPPMSRIEWARFLEEKAAEFAPLCAQAESSMLTSAFDHYDQAGEREKAAGVAARLFAVPHGVSPIWRAKAAMAINRPADAAEALRVAVLEAPDRHYWRSLRLQALLAAHKETGDARFLREAVDSSRDIRERFGAARPYMVDLVEKIEAAARDAGIDAPPPPPAARTGEGAARESHAP
jgi:hypothetical protein